MDTEALNKAIVDRWFTALWGDACNLSIVDELAAPDILLQYAEAVPHHGRCAVKAFMVRFRTAFPDLGFRRLGPLIADRDIVVLRWEGGGTHTGPAFDDFHIGPLPAASGRRILLAGHSALRIEDGAIREEAVWSTERKARLRLLACGLVA